MSAAAPASSLCDVVISSPSNKHRLEELQLICTSGANIGDVAWKSSVETLVRSICEPYCKEILLISATRPQDTIKQTAPDSPVHLIVVVTWRDADTFELSWLVPGNFFKATNTGDVLQIYEVAHYLEECRRCNVRLLETLLEYAALDVHRHSILGTLTSQVSWADLCCRDLFNRCHGQLWSLLTAISKSTVPADSSPPEQEAGIELTLQPGSKCHSLHMYAQCVLSNNLSLEQLKVKAEVAVPVTNVRDLLEQMKKDFLKASGMRKSAPDEFMDGSLRLLEEVRLDGIHLLPVDDVSPENIERARSFLSPHGGRIALVPPERLLYLTLTGSKLYRLNVASSDEDFLGIYAITPQELVRDYNQVNRQAVLDNRGKQLDSGDIALYEASKFTETMLNGSVEVIQMLFSDDFLYESPHFKVLKANRMKLLSEKVITNYCGYISKHFDFLKKPQKTPGKVFYHIYHKLGELERLCRGQPPQVQVHGEERDFILRIRQGPMEGEFSYDTLLQRAHERFDDLRARLQDRTVKLPEVGDIQFVKEWLFSVYSLPKELALQQSVVTSVR